jgi:hypothetical protein
LALKDWVTLHSDGRIKRYRISTTGRHALKRFLAEEEALRAGMSEEANPFAAQHGELATRTDWDGHGTRRRVRYNATESSFYLWRGGATKQGSHFCPAILRPQANGRGRTFSWLSWGRGWRRIGTGL